MSLLKWIILFVLFNAHCIVTASCMVEKRISTMQNEHVLAKVLYHTKWIDVQNLMSSSYETLRNTLISILDSKCNNSITSLQALSDEDLVRASYMYKFLSESNYRSPEQLLNMSVEDYRNTIISLNATNTSYSVSQLQGMDNSSNLSIAYDWWLKRDDSETKQKIDALNNITGSNLIRFDAKDNRGKNLDGMSIVRANETYTYLGVYHSFITGTQFKLYLAGSNDLINWTYLTELSDRSHQGDIKKWGNGYLVANEQDPVNGSNNIRIRYYSSYANLVANNHSNNIVLPRNFSTTAEGTPDIRFLYGNSPESSYIVIGFHYFNNNVQDQLAFGVLKNFSTWRAWKDEISNYNINKMGFKGNFGDRCGFVHKGEFVLQEAQLASNDWSSWRILLGDGAYYSMLSPVTAKGSKSFANPSISAIDNDNFMVSMFMPTEGNQIGERGELLYKINLTKNSTSVHEIWDNASDNPIKILVHKNFTEIHQAAGCQLMIYNLQGSLIRSIKSASDSEILTIQSPFIIRITNNNVIKSIKIAPVN